MLAAMAPAGPDYVLLIVGILLFSGASYGITTLEETPAGVLSVTWNVAEATHATEPGAFAEGSTAMKYANSHHNVTKVAVKATCADASPASGVSPATVEITVKAPDGKTDKKAGRCGSDIPAVEFTFAAVPEPTTVAGSSEEVAAELAKYDTTAGLGVFEVTVKNTRQQSSPVGLPGAVGVAQGKVEVHIFHFEPVLKSVSR